MTGLPFDVGLEQHEEAISVAELSRRIEAALSSALPSSVRVEGEVANATLRNGHRYFSLREPDASIGCVMWASDVRRCPVGAADGDRVIATGQVVHWAPGGRTQLRVKHLEPAGEGALLATFRARCDTLRAEGWFDQSAKQALPACPGRIAVLTSATGAALQDVIRTTADRFPFCRLTLVDVPVQGAAAANRIAAAISSVDRAAAVMQIDAIMLTRGGGSLEDLWAFNELAVARAIHACSVPLVAAIGHESDVTIAELVADARAATPTAAAMLLVPDGAQCAARLALVERALMRSMRSRLDHRGVQVASAGGSLDRAHADALQERRHHLEAVHLRLGAMRPDLVLGRRRHRTADLAIRLQAVAGRRAVQDRRRLDRLEPTNASIRRVKTTQRHLDVLDRALGAVDPQAVLGRGFSLTLTEAGTVLRSGDQVEAGQMLHTRLAEGEVASRVEPRPHGAVPSDHG